MAKKYDATISLYGITARQLGEIRDIVLTAIPADVDVSFSSDELTETTTEN